MNQKLFFYKILLLLLTGKIILFSGCLKKEDHTPDDTPTSGEIHISVDETFAPIMASEISTFEQIYTYARIHPRYKPEHELFEDLLSDSSRIIIASRKLNAEETRYFETLKIIPHTVKICYDAIAVITHPENNDTFLTFTELENILSGNITSWKQIFPGSPLSKMQIIFDHQNSSTVRYIKERFNIDSLPKNWFALKTNPSVIEYVSKNKNAIGLIGVNWISDKDDSVTRGFLRSVKVIGLRSAEQTDTPDEYYQPYQAYIARKYYPLTREIYIISREARAGLGSGFTAFVSSEKGQRIFLKAGLVPATAPLRIVEINNENIFDN